MDAVKVITVDIDTTGLKHSDQICRIVAFDHDVGFSGEALDLNLLPTCSFTYHATKLNGYSITELKGKSTLLFDNSPVEAFSQEKGIRCFFEYIQRIGKKNCILMLYNGKKTMAGFIIRGFQEHLQIMPEKLYSEFGIRFVDPYLMLDNQEVENLKQPTVYHHLFPNEEPYRTPNALEDAKALSKIVKEKFCKEELADQAVPATKCTF